MSETMAARQTLRWWERTTIIGLLVATIAFGVLVEIRSAFQQRRKGDFGVFARAGWAVRQGGDQLYHIACDNNWHYGYPPTLAILLVPLADPPHGETASFVLPYAASVAIWYVLSMGVLAWGIHALASALDPETERGSRRWWVLRLLPLLICLAPIGHTAARGQVNLLLLALLCGWLAATLRGRRFTGGCFLAGAICLKVIPAFLVLVPLTRRDVRSLVGCAVGLFVGLIALPIAAMGPAQTVDCYAHIWHGVVTPSMTQDANAKRAKELTNVTATDNHSFAAMLHNGYYLDRATRPLTASTAVRLGHWGLGATFTLLTVLVYCRRPSHLSEGQHYLLYGGAAMLCMMLVSPVCHLHYFCLLVPLTMGLIAVTRGAASYPPIWVQVLLIGFALTTFLPQLPGQEMVRDFGLASYGGLLLWAAAAVLVLRGRRALGALVQTEQSKDFSRAA